MGGKCEGSNCQLQKIKGQKTFTCKVSTQNPFLIKWFQFMRSTKLNVMNKI